MKDFNELYDKTVQCPICNNEFVTKKVRTSRLRLIKRDEDFLSHYNVENPIKYNVFVCPISAYHSKFSDITIADCKVVRENISSKWKRRDFGAYRSLEESIESYKLALINSTLLNHTNLEIGNLSLNLAWLYRLKQSEDDEKRFLNLTKEHFIKAYNFESLTATNMDDSKLSYLIGEISRRLEQREDALSWFNICLNLPSTRMNPTIDTMVREQWRLTKEMN